MLHLADISDEQRQVMVRNERLKSKCMASEEGILSELRPYQNARGVWGTVHRLINETSDALLQLQHGLDLTHLSVFDEKKCMVDCNQNVWPAELEASRAPELDFTKWHAVASNLQHIACKVEKMVEAAEAANAGTPKPHLSMLFASSCKRGAQDLQECENMVARRRLPVKTDSLAVPLEPVVSFINQLASMGSALLADGGDVEHIERIRRLKFDVEQVEETQRQLFADGEVKEAEDKYYEVLVRQEACCKCIQSRLGVAERLQGEVKDLKLRADAVMAEACEQYDRVLRDNEEFRGRCATDLDELRSTLDIGQQEHEAYLRGHQTEAEASDAALKENAERQRELWGQIASAEKELNRLAHERYTVIQKRIQALEEKEKHRVSFTNFSTWTASRTRELQNALDQCDVVAKVVKYFTTFLANRNETITMFFCMAENELNQSLDAIHHEYLDVFRNMYITAGDLRSKKAQALLQVQQDRLSAQMRLELCQESLDPAAKKYADKVKALRAIEEETSDAIGSIDQRTVKYLESFRPTEEALELTPLDDRHPVTALQKRNEQRRAKLSAYQQLMASDDTGEVLQIEDLPAQPRDPSPAETSPEREAKVRRFSAGTGFAHAADQRMSGRRAEAADAADAAVPPGECAWKAVAPAAPPPKTRRPSGNGGVAPWALPKNP